MTTVERALNSIGKKCFVDYFLEFKNCTDKHSLATKLLSENCAATSLSAQITRINNARWIFDNYNEKEALRIIINSVRINEATKKKAKEYYDML